MILSGQAFAQSPLSQLRSRLRKAPQDSSKVLIYKELSVYFRITNPDSAILLAQNGLALATRINYPTGIAIMYCTLADCYFNTGKIDLSKKSYLISMRIFQKLKYQQGIASCHNGLGIIAATQGMDKEAAQHFLKALKIAQNTNNTRGVVESYLKLGHLEDQNNNLDKALAYYKKGALLNSKLPPSTTTGILLNNTGIIYGKRNELDTALIYFLKALKSTSAHEYSNARLLSLINIGNVYQLQGKIREAFRYESEALKITRDRKLPEQEVHALINIASLLSSSKPDSSALLLQQALKITKTINIPHVMLEIYGAMVDLNKSNGNYKAAEQILETKVKLQDSLFTLKKSKEIAGLQASFDLVNETVKVQELKLKNEHIEFSRKIILAVSTGILLLLILSIFFFLRTKKLNKNLTSQKDELDKLNIFKDRLFSIIGHDLKSPITNIVHMLEVFEQDALTIDDIHLLIPRLKEQSESTLDVLDKLLAWGKLHLKSVNLHKTVFNAKELIQKNILLFKSTAAEKSIRLVDETPADVIIFADVAHVDFIIRNLVANAIKYTHEGGKVEIKAEFQHRQGFHTIIIKDNGIGIAREFQQKIFEAHNMSMEGTAKEIGNSIGLMLCKEFTKENGGIIELKSELGKGSQFCISFPSK